jgi:PPOX class probable F420-dependent enzyme
MNVANAPGWARELLEREPVGRLALVDEHDRPRVLPVTFALVDDAIWTAIDHKPKRRAEPARVRYLRRRPEASLVVDVYDDDWSRLRWVQVTGSVTVLDAGPDAALAALAAKYPQYERRPPAGPFIRLAIERAVWWRADELR